MKTSTVLLALFSVSGFEQAISAPVNEPPANELQTRATGTGDNSCDPKQITVKVNDKSALPFDADCWAMQCGGKDRVMQRVVTRVNTKNRQVAEGSTADKKPFKDTKHYGMKNLPPTIPWGLNQAWDSAEEFPFASTLQGGRGAYLFPVNKHSQDKQGGEISGMYNRKENSVKAFDPAKKGQPGAEDGTWFEITEFEGPVGLYCEAYNNKDTSVCHKKTADPRWGYDPAEYAYVYDHTTKTYKHAGK